MSSEGGLPSRASNRPKTVAPVPPTPDVPASAWHSGMLARFGPLYRLSGMPVFFRNLVMEDHAAERIRAAAARGPLVYVLHTRSWLDWLALNHVLAQQGLPLPVYTNGVDARPWMPVGDAWRAWVRSPPQDTLPDVVESGWLAGTIAAGAPTCVFLLPPRESMLRTPDADVLPALIDAQAQCEQPVQVVPIVVLWNRSPEPARTEVGRFLLGTEDHPGILGKLLALAKGTGGRDARVQVGEPVSLLDYASRVQEEPPARRVKALRLVLRRYLYREAQVVRGPRSRPRGWIRRQVLRGKGLQDLIAKEAAATGQPVDKLTRKVEKTFDHIAARFSFTAVRFIAFACRLIWNRIYSGIDVRPQDLERIREALRAGAPVLVPCHRSHLDYLLISSLLYEHDIVIPHIVAGENLSFWPLGAIFRRGGAFFIKRSFTGDRLFPAVFSAYMRELMRQEVPIEFFLEGGRSRTGKLLPPKLGVLGMVMDAASESRADREVTFLPIYVGYEQIAEERAYARELAGARKEKENVGQVVKATGVLTKQYGKVYLRVGEPLRARDLVDLPNWGSLSRARRNEALMGVGERILHRINAEAVALPTALVALALLAHPRGGVREAELRARADRLRAFLAAADVREGAGMDHLDGILAEALGRFVAEKQLQRITDGTEVVYKVVPERRVTLEYYKNALLHAFAPAAYFAAAMRSVVDSGVSTTWNGVPSPGRPNAKAEDEVARLFRVQQFVLRYEFILDPDADTDTHERRAIEALVAYGALAPPDADGLPEIADRGRLDEIANLTANFLESYLLLVRTAREQGAPVSLKELPRKALTLGKTLLAAEELHRPEALSLANLENAARAFAEEGVLETVEGGVVANAEAAASWERDLRRLLGTRR